jgi:hypothetical protein
MARILSVVWYKVLPAEYGGQKGIAHFNEHLGFRHEIHCLCSKDNRVEKTSYAIDPSLPTGKGQVLNPYRWLQILRKSRACDATHIIIEHCFYGLAGVLAQKVAGRRLVLHSHNIEAQRLRQIGRRGWRAVRWIEGWTGRRADLVLFKTRSDMEFAIEHYGVDRSRCLVTPYGTTRIGIPSSREREEASLKLRKRHGLAPEEKILLFTGDLDYGPNAEALEKLEQTILPTLEELAKAPFRLIVCGRMTRDEKRTRAMPAHPKCMYAGQVEDVETYYTGSDLFLNPVSRGGGIKVKTVDALSHNLTVVSTEHAAEGIDVPELADGKLLTSADEDLQGFCRNVTRALESPRIDTPETFFKAFHWRHITDAVADRIESL